MTQLNFQRTGTGYPVVFIHGYCETLEIWRDFVPLLSPYLDITTIDLPGFGQSPPLAEPFTVDLVADQVADFIHAQQFNQKPVPIGHSLGGYVVLSLVARHPGLINGAGLFHSTAFGDSAEKKANRNKAIEFVNRNGPRPFVDNLIPNLFANRDTDSVQRALDIGYQTPAATVTAYAAAMRDRPDRSSVLADLGERLLIIAGEQDSVVPEAVSREMAQLAKNAVFALLSGVGHMGMLEAPEACAGAVLSFMRKNRLER
ncbi:MAG: alpha/beta fold hydrolase [Cyclobacteriaceae bacterium]|jgi:pimeloyl-ACP methyl ester carboxylesterase